MVSKFRFFVALFFLVGIFGCQEEIQLRLASAAEALPSPRFEVLDSTASGSSARYFTIQVLDETGALAWHVRSNSSTVGPASFRYGEAPTGWTTVVAGRPLEEGQYLALVLGGPRGGMKFDVLPGGQVSASRSVD